MGIDFAYSEVARVLDQLRGASVVGNGIRRAITGAADSLRDAGAPEDHVIIAGRASAAIHQWELALCLGNADKQEAARSRLNDIGDTWRALPAIAA